MNNYSRIVEIHSGEYWVTCENGKYTVVCLENPEIKLSDHSQEYIEVVDTSKILEAMNV